MFLIQMMHGSDSNFARLSVVAMCRSELGAMGYIGRPGDEEFAAMLSDTSPDSAIEIVEQVRQAIAAMVIEASAGGISVTVSIALAAHTAGENDIDPALRRSDVAVYKAKSGERNPTVRWACQHRDH